MIHACPPMPLAAQRAARTFRPPFWDDRQAVRLKVFLIGLCLVAAAVLEGPW